MSTNYYFKLKNEIKLNVNIPGKIGENIINFLNKKIEDDKIQYIHIGSRGMGYKPLFEKTPYYSSVKEIIDFYNKNKEYVDIVTEYEQIISLNELKEDLFNHNKDKIVKSHLNLWDGIYIDEDGYEFSPTEFS